MLSSRYVTGHDEILPLELKPSNPFSNWGASIVDSLETLLIMELPEEYNLCRAHVNQVDFRLVEGKDWAYGYRPSPSALADTSTPEYLKEPQRVGRDTEVRIGVFETHIRYLGGLLGAYDLSGDELMLERAKDLADILGTAFMTDTSIAVGYIHPGR